MWRTAGLAAAIVMIASADAIRAQPAAPDRAVLCADLEQPPFDRARALDPLGDSARAALVALAGSSQLAEAACGVSGLAALHDPRVAPPLAAALDRPSFRDDAYRFARWGAYAAGGPSSGLGAAFLPVVALFDDATLWAAAGDDAVRLLGAIDHPAARNRLVTALERPSSDAELDAAIHALGRQGEPRVHDRIMAIGREAVASRSGNLTYEQARRIGAVTFYLLALGAGTQAAGLEMLRQMTPGDQADVAAWTVQTWCERAVRRPADKGEALRLRDELAAVFDAMGLRWRELARGSFRCE